MTLIKEWIIFLLARGRNFILLRWCYQLSEMLVKGCQNYSYNHNLNGERRVIRCLSQHGNCNVVFDVGAHCGDWATMALDAFPRAEIHSFEIMPETFATLQTRMSGQPRIHLNPIGLSDRASTIELHYDPQRSAQTTIFLPSVTGNFVVHKAKVIAGDEYCADKGITKIDFLKVDVEGAEHLVLKGLQNQLAAQQIRVIQFEYGKCNIRTRFLLLDFYEMLESYGYRVGKIFPDSVDFRPYQFEDENFIGPNFLAVLASEQVLIRHLGR